MGLGQSIGQDYIFNPSQISGGQREVTPSGITPGFEMEDPASGLQVTEHLTDEYFNKWANLQSYAKSAWKNYGVDVTAPDLTDPSQQRLSKIWLKGLADIKAAGNNLQRGRENEIYNFQKASSDADFIQGEDLAGGVSSLQGAGTTRTTKGDEAVIQNARRSYNTRSEQYAQQREVDQYVSELRRESEGLEGIEKEAMDARIRTVEASRPGYIQQAVNTSMDKKRAAAKATKTLADLYVKAQGDARTGSTEAIDAIRTFTGVQEVNVLQKEDGNTALEVIVKGGGDPILVDLDDAKNGVRALSQLTKERAEGYKYADADAISEYLANEQSEGRLDPAFSDEEKSSFNLTTDRAQEREKSFLGHTANFEAIESSVNDLQEIIDQGVSLSFLAPAKDGKQSSPKKVVDIEASGRLTPFGDNEVVITFEDGSSSVLDMDDSEEDRKAYDNFMKRNMQLQIINKRKSIQAEEINPFTKSGMIRMRLPNGSVVNMPSENVSIAEENGAVIVE